MTDSDVMPDNELVRLRHAFAHRKSLSPVVVRNLIRRCFEYHDPKAYFIAMLEGLRNSAIPEREHDALGMLLTSECMGSTNALDKPKIEARRVIVCQLIREGHIQHEIDKRTLLWFYQRENLELSDIMVHPTLAPAIKTQALSYLAK